ncbi:MAG: hypothetical protein II583_07615 [Oscillospiraceae bacterium]|nr:hypothetical protein [Oscillospiraceae bacterium]
MKLEDRIERASEGSGEPKLSAGEGFVKFIRPAGAALFLILFVIVTVFLFTAKGTPVEGYEPPHDSSYYREHTEELAAEIEENMLPLIDAEGVTVSVSGGKVLIAGAEDGLRTVRQGVIHYYAEDLFEFLLK